MPENSNIRFGTAASAVAIGAVVITLLVSALGWLPMEDHPHFWDAVQAGVVASTAVVVFWSTVETQRLRRISESQLEDLRFGVKREQMAHQVRHDLSQQLLHRQLSSWVRLPERPGALALWDWLSSHGGRGWGIHSSAATGNLSDMGSSLDRLAPEAAERFKAIQSLFYAGASEVNELLLDADFSYVNPRHELPALRRAANAFEAILTTLESGPARPS